MAALWQLHSAGGGRKEGRKAFFFAKKKQKTFSPAHLQQLDRRPCGIALEKFFVLPSKKDLPHSPTVTLPSPLTSFSRFPVTRAKYTPPAPDKSTLASPTSAEIRMVPNPLSSSEA